MLISYNWLKDYININIDAHQMAQRLTDVGIEVENVHYLGGHLKECWVGRIEKIEPHPNADKLVLCYLNIGHKQIQVVTGAPNIEVGQLVPVAIAGARLPGGVKIEATLFRGAESQGMLLSAEEIGLSSKVLTPEQREGIFILPSQELNVGECLAAALGFNDYIIELDLTPNRADCSSMIGLAYEVAAILGIEVKEPKLYQEGDDNKEIDSLTSVNIEATDLCPQYSMCLFEDINITSSPLWMQNRLRKAGLRPINNIVDITNYVMVELGQPLHAFDFDQLEENRIVVRRAYKGEEIITLDEERRALSEDVLVIADAQKPVGIAGVMGGYNSEITPKTRRMLLESASFHYASIRRTSRALGLATDAASRFGKGIDQNKVILALQRAAYLAHQLGVARIIPGMVSSTVSYPKPLTLKLRPQRVNQLLGTNITTQQMQDILQRLGLEVSYENQQEKFTVVVPTRRLDLKEEVDLVEEIGRLYGFDNIEGTIPETGKHKGTLPKAYRVREKTRQVLHSAGVSHVINYSFCSREDLDNLGLDQGHIYMQMVSVLNPLTERHGVMRTTLLPGLLQTACYNLNRQQRGILIAEIGRVYYQRDKELPLEHEILGILAGGRAQRLSWNTEEEVHDYFSLKGIVEAVFSSHNIEVRFERGTSSYLHPGRSATIWHQQQEVGFIGEVHPDVLEKVGISERLVVAEINHDIICEKATLWRKYIDVTLYPAVTRDMALVVKQDIPLALLMQTIREAGAPLLECAELFDIYEGPQIPSDSRGCAFSLRYRGQDGTLTDEAVNNVHKNIIERMLVEHGAMLR